MSAWETAGVIAGVAGGILALLGGLCAAAVKGVRAVRRVSRFLDQWLGHGVGVNRVPGVIERVECLDERTRRVEAQVFPNGGGSLRDAIDAAREQLTEHLQSASARDDRIEEINRKLGDQHG